MCNWSLITYVPPPRFPLAHVIINTRNVYHTHAHFDKVCSALEQLRLFFRENLNDAKEKGYTEAKINVIYTCI